MNIKIFNTLNRRIEKFLSLKNKKVYIYTCGPTVYQYAHIGNLRTYIFIDVLKRTFLSLGYKIKHVLNITDVGHLEGDQNNLSLYNDKINLTANLLKSSPWNISKFYERSFFQDCNKLHIIKPDIICRATDHINNMKNMIEIIIKKRKAYKCNGNIYFDISKKNNYYNLSKNYKENNKNKVYDIYKKNKDDFVLWFSNSKFSNQIMQWDSSWGRGFPGWHIECSAMASKYLGKKIDIHTGGIDHIPIHHSNEIAQSESFWNNEWVNYWVHNNFLKMNKFKMSKSKNNYLTLTDLLHNGFDSSDYKYFCLNTHYRSDMLFNWYYLTSAKKSLERLRLKVSKLDFNINFNNDYKTKLFKKNKYIKQIKNSIYNDFNTPKILEIFWKLLNDSLTSDLDKIYIIKFVNFILALNLNIEFKKQLNEEQKILINKRNNARLNKDWKSSDKIRNILLLQGIMLEDLENDTKWHFI